MNIEKKTYQKITPATEGNYLTTYREGDDIKTYEGVKAMYTPADFDASTVREITPEQHLSYHAAKEQALQEETEQASVAGTEAGNGKLANLVHRVRRAGEMVHRGRSLFDYCRFQIWDRSL